MSKAGKPPPNPTVYSKTHPAPAKGWHIDRGPDFVCVGWHPLCRHQGTFIATAISDIIVLVDNVTSFTASPQKIP
jgi:hypothetical protein